jgi:VCBS repeat-containing protein
MANSRPSAAYDLVQVNEFDVITGNLLDNDSDPDGSPLFLRFFDGVRVEAKQSPDQVTIIDGEHGTFLVRPDGTFTYELDPEVAERISHGHMVIEQLSYKVSDGMGGTDVSTLRLEIKGGVPGLELVKIDFEDLEPGTDVPEGYKGFDWGDGWVVDIDEAGDTPDAHVAQPKEFVTMVSLESGEDFDLVEIILNGETEESHPITVRAYNDGAPHPFYVASSGTWPFEPSQMDLQWQGIDAFEITYSTPGLWIDEILVAVPA